jgi:hypothetical protein
MSDLTLFEVATRENYTFSTDKGNLSITDLWTLPLLSKRGVCLNGVAQAIHAELESLGNRMFVSSNTTNPQRRTLQRKLDIVLRIIQVREAENTAKAAAKQNADRREKLLEALEAKQAESIQNLTEEQIKQQLAELGAA